MTTEKATVDRLMELAEEAAIATMNVNSAEDEGPLEELTALVAAVRELRAYAERLAAQGGQEWIPVTERLPDFDVSVLVYRPADSLKLKVARRVTEESTNSWRLDSGLASLSSVTHWQPLPPAPKMKE